MKTNKVFPNVEEQAERWAYIELILSSIVGVLGLIGGIGANNAGLIVCGIYITIQGFAIFTIIKLWIKTSLYAVRINNILEQNNKQ